MSEKYSLDEQNGITSLSLKMDIREEYSSAMDAMTKKTLQAVKELAEA